MAVALDGAAACNPAEQFKQRTINRRYVALYLRKPKENSGRISLAIGRSPSEVEKMSTG